MSEFILTEEQWAALEAAEGRFDAWNAYGLHNITDCIDRQDSQMLAGMWANAEWGVEAYAEGADDDDFDVEAAIADRVVIASVFLYTGEIIPPKVPA